MAPPFEVPVASSAVCRWLWALKYAPGAKIIYRQDLLKREILSYLAPLRFIQLHEAVEAALGPIGSGEVRLVRNVTLPAPLNHKALCNRHGSTILWAMVKPGRCLTLRSVRGGPWRIRHHVPGGNGAAGCALFSLGHEAKLKVHAVDFEIVCVQTASPAKALLAVFPPRKPVREERQFCLQDRTTESDVESDSEDLLEGELEQVEGMCQERANWRAAEPNGTMVELSGCPKTRGYDSRLVVRGAWAFNSAPPLSQRWCFPRSSGGDLTLLRSWGEHEPHNSGIVA